MKSGIALKSALALSASALALTWAASPAAADSQNIKGSYFFTGSASCLVSPGHFDAPNPLPGNPQPGVLAPGSGFNIRLQPNDITLPNLPNGTNDQQSFTRSFSVTGIRTFDGNGHGTVNGSAVGHDGRPTPGPTGWPHFPPSAGSSTFSYTFTYTVDGNGGWSATMDRGSFKETSTSGSRAIGPNGVDANGQPVDAGFPQTATMSDPSGQGFDVIPPIVGSITNDGKVLTASHPATVVETRLFSNGDVWPEICARSRVFTLLPNNNGNGNGNNGNGK
jgi:hypothetical protein